MIPRGDTLKAARVEADGFYARLVAPWLARVRFRRRPLCLALTRAEQLLLYILRQRSAFDMRAGPGSPRLYGGSINPSRLTVDFFHNSSGHRLRSLPVVRNNPCSAPSALRLHPEHPKTSTVHSSSHGLSLSPLEKTRTSYRCALICSATTMSGSGKPAYPHPPIVPRFIFGSPPSTARLTPSSRSTAMLWTTSRSSRKPRG